MQRDASAAVRARWPRRSGDSNEAWSDVAGRELLVFGRSTEASGAFSSTCRLSFVSSIRGVPRAPQWDGSQIDAEGCFSRAGAAGARIERSRPRRALAPPGGQCHALHRVLSCMPAAAALGSSVRALGGAGSPPRGSATCWVACSCARLRQRAHRRRRLMRAAAHTWVRRLTPR